MARQIPRLQPWRVTYYGAAGETLARVEVLAVNKRFALWNGHDAAGYVPGCERVTAGRIGKGR